jgi:hypothetical protein
MWRYFIVGQIVASWSCGASSCEQVHETWSYKICAHFKLGHVNALSFAVTVTCFERCQDGYRTVQSRLMIVV